MIEIKTRDNEQDYRYVRIEVFMKEQGFQNEFDELDAIAVHITVYVDGSLRAVHAVFQRKRRRRGSLDVLRCCRSFGIRDWAVFCFPRWRKSFAVKREAAVFWMHNAVPVRFMRAMATPYAEKSIWMSMFLMFRWRSCCKQECFAGAVMENGSYCI